MDSLGEFAKQLRALSYACGYVVTALGSLEESPRLRASVGEEDRKAVILHLKRALKVLKRRR